MLTSISNCRPQAAEEYQLRIFETRLVPDSLKSALLALLSTNEVNQTESIGHLYRVGHCARILSERVARRYSLSRDWIDHMELYAPLHDIGKVFVSQEILKKPGRLTADEFAHVKQHTIKGRTVIDSLMSRLNLKDSDFRLGMLRNIVTYHHESYNGNGYPSRLRGEGIPLEARITAIVDVLDALMSDRSYKPAWSLEKSIQQLEKMSAAGHLDPYLVEVISTNRDSVAEMRLRLAA